MTMCDLVIHDGTVVTATDVAIADVGIKEGRIQAIGGKLVGTHRLDAAGRLVLPGGIDSHCHIEQLSASGIMNADTFESGTRAAALGGTTTVIPFVAQHVGDSLEAAAADYHARAQRGAIVDYAFHLILADPRPDVLEDELPPLVAAGHGSLKIFLTYDRLKLSDEQVLAVLETARRHGLMVCVHAENHAMISWMQHRLLQHGKRAAKYHGPSHPRVAEAEAIHRIIAMSRLVDQPIMIFHVSTVEGLDEIRRARAQGAKIWAETCTHYLTLTEDAMDRPNGEGAKWICSPPLRDTPDVEALWRGLEQGTLDLVSSDHAPYAANSTGKYRAGPDPDFKSVPNGLPGLTFRLPLLFDAMVSRGRMDLGAFARLTATAPAELYNLADRKGAIAVGKDADLVLWDPDREVTISADLAGDLTGYTPFEGMRVRGWPVTVLRRGEIVVDEGDVKAASGSGKFLPRQGGAAAAPSGSLEVELDLE